MAGTSAAAKPSSAGSDRATQYSRASRPNSVGADQNRQRRTKSFEQGHDFALPSDRALQKRATQLQLLVDGAIATDLVRNDPSIARAARDAARVLLKNAGIGGDALEAAEKPGR
jgi:hypothetical protein